MLSEESQNIIVTPEQGNQKLANRISQDQSFKLYNFQTKKKLKQFSEAKLKQLYILLLVLTQPGKPENLNLPEEAHQTATLTVV